MERIEVNCPHCGNSFKLKAEKSSGFCTKCGNGISIDKNSGRAIIKSQNNEETMDSQKSNVVSEEKYTNSRSGSSITSFLLGLIVIASAFFSYSYTVQNSEKSIELFGIELVSQKYEIVDNEMTFLHGVKNGILVMGKTFADVFISGSLEYIAGFDHSFIGNALWLLFGWMWTFTKAFLIAIPRYFVSLYILFTAGNSLLYYAGYVISTLFTWALVKAED